ncbi:MAG TPA: Dam family site-specific DNA-(adenine-N6)-methyltransferase [Candidatus Paceibacterota bacterium]|nr:Dam family site-specific DNA-(adenine-N6)-methyltransferase [Candidatus Paceibacterota bacterium]
MSIEINLKKILEREGKTLYKLCKDTGLSYQQGHAIANKKTTRIDLTTIDTLCNYLQCDPSNLISFKESILKKELEKFPLTNNSQREAENHEKNRPKPFLQWVGGKRGMVAQYKNYFPKKYNRYFEPFLGGGAIFFELNPEKSFLNDNNRELLETYKAVRDFPELVIDTLKKLKERHSEKLYEHIRNLDRNYNLFSHFRNYEIAARAIYLNQTCFNGIYRVNGKGQFNVPIGSSLDKVICDAETILKASKTLKKTSLECSDFEEATKNVAKKDLVFFDPPYYPISKTSDFTRYTKERFYEEDQIRLRKTVTELHKKGAYVMLSNSDCKFIRDLYKDFNIYTVQSSRSLNSNTTKRGKVSEVLITNY